MAFELPVAGVPDAAAVKAILDGIGAPESPLTVTLLWDANVDLDLHLYCDGGEEIYFSNKVEPGCDATLDADMTASKYGNIRGDGVQGQIENISVQAPVAGFAYNGRVKYYGGSGNAPFTIIISGTDAGGTLRVYAFEQVEDFSALGVYYAYTFDFPS